MNDKRIQWLVLGLIGLAVSYAWLFRHVEDDAFITFRYSKHLVEGIGPVWNADQRVEGYTNFLWMLLMAIPIAMGLDPVLPSVLLSLACLALNLWLLLRIAQRMAGDAKTGFWIWLPVLCNHTLLLFATSGMETAMNGLLWTVVFYQLQLLDDQGRKLTTPRMIALGLSLAICLLSRPEAAFLVIAALLLVWAIQWTNGNKSLPSLLWTMLPITIVVGTWLLWKYDFYGDLLPNTYYVKTAQATRAHKWIGLFLISSGLWIPWLFGLKRIPANIDPRGSFVRLAWAISTMFLLLQFISPGDYLEFRLITPVLPLLVMLPLLRLERLGRHQSLRWAAVAMMLLAFLWGQGHGRLFKIWQMNPLVHPQSEGTHALSFADQGKALGQLFGHDSSIRIAIGASGAIPYYSECYGIDLYGLNEPRTGFSSYPTGYGPGHGRLADWRFIQRRDANLVSLRCDYAPSLLGDRKYTIKDPQIAEVAKWCEQEFANSNPRILELPLGNGFVEVCLYLKSHPKIDSIIKNKPLKIYYLEKK